MEGESLVKFLASFPGLHCFCSSVCIQYNTWKGESSKKTAKAWEHFITWMTRGGCRGGGFYISNTYYTSSSSAPSLGKTPEVHTQLVFSLTSKKFALRYMLAVGYRPPYIHLASAWCHSCCKCLQAFPDSRCSSPSITSMYIPNTNWRTKMPWGRPGNEAIKFLSGFCVACSAAGP